MRKPFTLGGIPFQPRLTLTIILTTLLPMLDHYGRGPFSVNAYNRFLLYFVVPALFIRLLWREPLTAYGLRWGNRREGALWVLAALIGMGSVIWFFAQVPAVQAYYQARTPPTLGGIALRGALEMFGWEFIWRGWLLFTLARYLGPGPAVWLQAVPFAFMHLGKPELETLTTIFGGAAFGVIAWRTQSFLYGWLIHWFMIAWTMLIAAGFL